MTAWQPIETAPKDGTRILLFDGMGIAIASWWVPDPTDFDDDDDFDEPLPGWCVESAECVEFWHEPTHWMPLPEPPNGEGGK